MPGGHVEWGEAATDNDPAWSFFPDLSPAMLGWVAAQGGYAPPPLDAFDWLEIGGRNGVTANVLAAAYPSARFHAVESDPVRVANARGVARSGKLDNVTFHEAGPAGLAALGLPELDYIVAHGGWSRWSPAERQAVVELARTRLKPGGVLYLAYDALPGWAALGPVRRLLVDVAATLPGDPERKAAAAAGFVKSLADAGGRFAEDARQKRLVERLLATPPAKLAEEWLDPDWRASYFTDVARELAPAKLAFAGSTALVRNLDELYVPKGPLKALEKIDDPVARELPKDLAVLETFRRDVWVRPTAAPSRSLATFAPLLDRVVGALQPAERVPREIKVPSGVLRFKQEHDEAVIAWLAAAPRTVGDVMRFVQERGGQPQAGLRLARMLVAAEAMRPFAKAFDAPAFDRRSRFTLPSAFNRAVLEQVWTTNELRSRTLASPVSGSGWGFGAREAFFLLGVVEAGLDGAVAWAWSKMRDRNRHLVVDGRRLEGRDAHVATLEEEKALFAQRKLARYVRLGVLEPVP